MGIGGISDYSNVFANYRVPEIPSVNYEQLKKAEEAQPIVQEPKEQAVSTQDISLTIEEPARKTPVNVKEISLTFNAGEDYGYIGKDSNIEALDMQKAISDMQKDQVLQQYQYFVGKAENLFPTKASEDGFVFLKF